MQEMRRQLRAVSEMQRGRLPRSVPQPMGWRIAIYSVAGSWPGGDYYDVVRLPDRRLVMMIADASDQGGPAAVMAAMVRLLLHACPLSSGVEKQPYCPFHDPLVQPPHVLLGHLNRVLAANLLDGQFVTAFSALLNPQDGMLHYANAGHPAPRWWHAASRTVEPLRDALGRPLAIDVQATYHHKRIVLAPGDMVALYTGGLLAVRNREGQAFRIELLDALLRETADDGAEAVAAAVQGCLADFLSGQKPEDDLTLLVVERQE